MRFANQTSSIRAATRREAGLLPMVVVPFCVLAATFVTGCSQGDPSCLFGCECQSPSDCDDGTECTRDFCGEVNGVLTCQHPPESSGLVCSSGGGRVCDGMGNCVECNQASDCPDDGDACTVATCQQQSCGVEIVDCPPVLTGSEHEILRINDCPGFPGRTHWQLRVDYEDANGDVTQSGTRLFVNICQQEFLPDCGDLEVEIFTISGDGFSGSVDSAWCTEFSESDWVEFTATIRDAAGNESNAVTERVPRPPGAN